MGVCRRCYGGLENQALVTGTISRDRKLTPSAALANWTAAICMRLVVLPHNCSTASRRRLRIPRGCCHLRLAGKQFGRNELDASVRSIARHAHFQRVLVRRDRIDATVPRIPDNLGYDEPKVALSDRLVRQYAGATRDDPTQLNDTGWFHQVQVETCLPGGFHVTFVSVPGQGNQEERLDCPFA